MFKKLFHKKNKKTIAFVQTAVISGFLLGGGIILWASMLTLPDLGSFDQRKVLQSTKIYDRTGEILLYDVHQNIQRTVIPFEEMSRHVKNATVAIEDENFYNHMGVEPLSFIRAMLVNFSTMSFSQGGSTITQQVVKNSLLTKDKKISRKLKEWVLAVKLDRAIPKDQILELYLNESPYGGSLYGIEEASQNFFGKSASDLTLPEAAYLAALPQAPTYYSPHGNHTDALERRKNLVLEKMLENGFITQEEHDEARATVVTFLQQQDTGIKAPHFVFFIREYLENKYGKQAVDEDGLRVITTLDYELQEKAEEIVYRYAMENSKNYNASNAALVAIDPTTGQVLTMVGSRDYFDEEIDGNFNVAVAPNRQPGSSFKPFIYATAFNKGYTPETVVFDVPTQFSTACAPDNFTSDGDCYSPTNYDDKFRGPITFRNALAQSINIPAVKAFYLAGMKDSLKTARDMGVQSLSDISRYGLTLVLGGGEVSLIDMTSAYGVFANEGVRNPYVGVLRVEDSQGNVLEEFTPRPIPVLPKQTALKISDILSDNAARTPSYGTDSPLHFPGYDVAAKTGTTNEYRDAWILGYTPSITVGAWAGNNDSSSMEKRVAGYIIAPLWNEFMDIALTTRENRSFEQPAVEDATQLKPVLRGVWMGNETYQIDTLSGKLATPYTPAETRGEIVIPSIHSILTWVDKSDPRGPVPQNPANDPQYTLWEYGVQRWKANQGISEQRPAVPSAYDDIHTPGSQPLVSITSPVRDAQYGENDTVTVSLASGSQNLIVKAEYFVNGVFIGSSSRSPFSFSFVPRDLPRVLENNTLKVVVRDSLSNTGTSELHFFVR
jgi:1A family penicillin-binding protein